MDITQQKEQLSPWWKHALLLTMACGFTILIWLSARTYRDAPPIPDRVMTPSGEMLFTGGDIRVGQQVFLKYGLMENGTVWGHGAYLGPDFSAEYLHGLATCTADVLATERYSRSLAELTTEEQNRVNADVRQLLKKIGMPPGPVRLPSLSQNRRPTGSKS